MHLMRRGSLRKVLPSLPDSSTRSTSGGARSLAGGARITKGTNAEAPMAPMPDYDTAHLELCLAVEYTLACRHAYPGLYTIPSAASPLVWFGVVFARSGYYERGVFRFTINFAESLTRGTAPDVVFDDELYHPLVAADSQQLCVSRWMAVWNLPDGAPHVWQLLQYIGRMVHCVDTSDPINKQAAELYEHKRSAFASRAAQCVQRSLVSIMERRHADKHAIVFSQYDSEQHGAVRQALLQSTSHAHPLGMLSTGHAHSAAKPSTSHTHSVAKPSESHARSSVAQSTGHARSTAKQSAGHAHPTTKQSTSHARSSSTPFKDHVHSMASLNIDDPLSATSQGDAAGARLGSRLTPDEYSATDRAVGYSWVRPGSFEPFSR